MIIKHVSSKSSNYGATQEYMEHEHDKEGKQLEEKRFYLCDTLNVENKDTWASECRAANEYYKQNQKKSDVKQHQYIISFSAEESKNLTPEDVLQIGKDWCQDNLPGHQAILYVHQDGNNQSGNLHVHVNINSVRIEETEPKEWMREQDKFYYAEGLKHSCNAQFKKEMRKSAERITEKYNIKMQERTGKKVSEKEYYADLRGKQKQGSEFDTQKEEIRQCIQSTVPQCMENGKLNEEKYINEMREQWGITVTESRGRYSYMHPEWERKRPVSDRKLGEDYRKENIINGFKELENRGIKQTRDTDELVRSARTTTSSARANANNSRLAETIARQERHNRENEQKRRKLEESKKREVRVAERDTKSQRRTHGLHL